MKPKIRASHQILLGIHQGLITKEDIKKYDDETLLQMIKKSEPTETLIFNVIELDENGERVITDTYSVNLPKMPR